MSLVVLCFPCCVDEQPPPRRRPKIDRTMIGEPMGFKHTGHIGSGEIATGFDIHNVQDQMQSKGGYDYSCNLSEIEPEGVDLKHDEPVDNGSPGNNESNQSENTKENETQLAAQTHDNEVRNENNTNQDNVETLKPDDTNTIQQANQL